MTTSVDGSGRFSFRNVPRGDDVLVFQGPGVNAQLPLPGVVDQEDIRMTVVVNGTTATLDADERDEPGNNAEIEGTITSVTATPPSIMVGTTSVSVPAGTPIDHDGNKALSFSSLVVGERVEVKASSVGGVMTASSIELKSDIPPVAGAVPPPGDDEGENEGEAQGTVSAKAGTCPTITFTVTSSSKSTPVTTSVSTNANTKFEESSCAALVNGVSVEVKGTRQTNGSILASQVEMKGKDN